MTKITSDLPVVNLGQLVRDCQLRIANEYATKGDSHALVATACASIVLQAYVEAGSLRQTEPIDCTVIDMSASGACLSVQRPQDIPTNLEFLHGTIRRKCCVVWRRGFQVGISYLAGVERSRVGSGLSRPSRGER
jgi:hypothetical protein